MSLSICTYGNPVLREKAKRVEVFNEELRALSDEMIKTMHQENGVGLAAEQVGQTKAIFVVDVPAESDLNEQKERENPDLEMPLILVNPKIVAHGEEVQEAQEGCLSFPEIFANVERWIDVDVEYQDLDGEKQTTHAKGLVARAIQHELDHLNAVLLVDHMSHVKRVASSGKLKRLAKKTKMSL